ncbi:hypothetical protein [Photobacterium damselae]|uniref:hypothetical protein n=1 Tax=Photobacterium damselae TaxID=38293 RepID=UPI001F2F4B29|nr:hypothetical protein [Photobacterium damselae]UKA04801.1 hypothetical protein IHC89_21400 [Photobacterium damselae subsp. damselae]
MARKKNYMPIDNFGNDVTDAYKHIVPKIARLRNVSPACVSIFDHPCGEDTIFVKGDWGGYIDDELFSEIDLLDEYHQQERTESQNEYIRRLKIERDL